MNRHKELRAAVERTLDDLDILERELSETSRGHGRVRFLVGDARVTYFFSGSPGDERSLRNTVAGIRRLARQCGGA